MAGLAGIGYYHISDTYIALFSRFIPVGVWEAVYLIQGLLDQQSKARPTKVHTDTQGQALPVYALAHLFGFDLMPRVRNWKDLFFYRSSAEVRYRHTDALFGEPGCNVIDWDLIENHYLDMMRVVLSIQEGKISSATLLRQQAITAAGELGGLYALATNLPGPGSATPLTALDVLKTYKDQWIAEQRHRDLKQTLKVRPVFLHNDGRIQAELRAALGPGVPLPGILPEGRAAKPTARAVLAAFDGLQLTYTPAGIVLDHLSPVQRQILALLNIPLPWPEKPT